MLKLLKYELLGSYRQFCVTFLIFLIGCFVLPYLPLPQAIMSMFLSIVVVAVLGIIISIYVNIILYFKKSMFSRAGYLTLTLPTSTQELILVKLLGAMIWSIVAGVILVVGVSFFSLKFANVSFFDFISKVFHFLLSIQIDMGSLMGLLITFLFTLSATILSFYFVITFVHTRYVRKNRTIVAVAIYCAGLFLNIFITNHLPLKLVNWDYYTIMSELFLSILFYCGTVYLIDHYIELE